MTRKMVLLIVVLAIVTLIVSGCAVTQKAPQSKHRGNPNSPFMDIKPLVVDWNLAMKMSEPDYKEYVRRVNEYNDYIRNIANVNAETAYSDKQWENDPNSGPAVVPYTMTRQGVGVYDPAAQTKVMREEANRLRERAQEILKE